MKLNTASMAAALAMAMTAPVAHAQSSAPTAAATLPDAFGSAPAVQSPPAPAASSNTSSAQSQVALREAILSIQGNQIDYTLFSDDLGAQMREQAEQFGSLLAQFGALQALTYQSQQEGAQLFEAQFENQKTEWIIGLDDDGRIAVLLFRPADN